MRAYRREQQKPWVCGYWNGSPLDIGLSGTLYAPPHGEVTHFHPYHEYYIGLEGRARVRIEGQDVTLEANTVVMVAPGERHRIVWVDPEIGARWIIVKERSEPDSKILAPDEDERDGAGA